MANPFAGIVTQGFKDLHKYLIDALLEDTALTELCTIHYESSWEDCPNCGFNTLTGRSDNIYILGGPIPFDGICPYCMGQGRIKSQNNSNLYLAPIWDSKQWMPQVGVHLEDISVQTMSKIGTYDDLTRATSITISSGIKRLGISDFVIKGAPTPLTYGATNFILVSWGQT